MLKGYTREIKIWCRFFGLFLLLFASSKAQKIWPFSSLLSDSEFGFCGSRWSWDSLSLGYPKTSVDVEMCELHLPFFSLYNEYSVES